MPPSNDSYNFITNPAAPTGGPGLMGRLPGPEASMKKRVITVALFGGIFIILLIIIFAIISHSGKSGQAALITVAKQQSELSGAGQLAEQQATQQVTKNLAINTQLILSSDQFQLLGSAKKVGQAIPKSQLTIKSSPLVSQLTAAESSGTFDNAFVSTMQSQIPTYQSNLQAAYNQINSLSLKKQIANDYQHATALLSQANSAAKNLN